MAIAASAMRQVLIDRARSRLRGAAAARLPWSSRRWTRRPTPLGMAPRRGPGARAAARARRASRPRLRVSLLRRPERGGDGGGARDPRCAPLSGTAARPGLAPRPAPGLSASESTMNERDDWKRLDALLQQALDLPPGERNSCWWGRARGTRRSAPGWRSCSASPRETRTGCARRRPCHPGNSSAYPDLEDAAGGADPPTGAPPGALRDPQAARSGRDGASLLRPRSDSRSGGRDQGAGRDVPGESAGLRRFERERASSPRSATSTSPRSTASSSSTAPLPDPRAGRGETLAERLARGPMPLREALAVAVQMAEGWPRRTPRGGPPGFEALERDAGHQRAGEARRLRPGEGDGGGAQPVPPATPRRSRGAILGTAPYMSPEQINGSGGHAHRHLGLRCLLYEMLTGKRAFAGQGLAAVWPPSCVTSPTGPPCRAPCPRRCAASCGAACGRTRVTGSSTSGTRASSSSSWEAASFRAGRPDPGDAEAFAGGLGPGRCGPGGRGRAGVHPSTRAGCPSPAAPEPRLSRGV